jgi:hypothetical protein
MPDYSREDLEDMDREDLKALLDERGLEYSPQAHTPTLVNLLLEDQESEEGEEVAPHTHPPADDPAVATSQEVAVREGEEEEGPPDYYPVRAYSPWELPANTAVAQQYLNTGAVVVDTSLVPDDDVLAAANNEIELYGSAEDPRLSGGGEADDFAALTPKQLASKAEVEPLPTGPPESKAEEDEADVDKEEAKV